MAQEDITQTRKLERKSRWQWLECWVSAQLFLVRFLVRNPKTLNCFRNSKNVNVTCWAIAANSPTSPPCQPWGSVAAEGKSWNLQPTAGAWSFDLCRRDVGASEAVRRQWGFLECGATFAHSWGSLRGREKREMTSLKESCSSSQKLNLWKWHLHVNITTFKALLFRFGTFSDSGSIGLWINFPHIKILDDSFIPIFLFGKFSDEVNGFPTCPLSMLITKSAPLSASSWVDEIPSGSFKIQI